MALWVLLAAVAAVPRIALALHPGLWADEIFSLAMATGHSLEHHAGEANPVLGDFVEPPNPQPPSAFRRYMQHDASPAGPGRVIRAVQLSDTSPPLYYLVLNLWTRIFGTSDAALRLFSTACAMACLPLLWLLGLDVGGRRSAIACCVLFAVSPLSLYYAAEGRMYSLVWLLTLLLAWSTLSLSKSGPRPQVLALWILSAGAGLLTHYFFVFVLAAVIGWLFLYPGKLSRPHVVGLALVTTAIVLPWYAQIPESLGRWRVTSGWLDRPLTADLLIINPIRLAASYVSVSGIWGGDTPERSHCCVLLLALHSARLAAGAGAIVYGTPAAPVDLGMWRGLRTSCLRPVAWHLYIVDRALRASWFSCGDVAGWVRTEPAVTDDLCRLPDLYSFDLASGGPKRVRRAVTVLGAVPRGWSPSRRIQRVQRLDHCPLDSIRRAWGCTLRRKRNAYCLVGRSTQDAYGT